MKNRIGSRGKIGASLPHPGEQVEEPFPEFIHDKHLVCCITMQKEALAKERKIPMQKEEYDDDHSVLILVNFSKYTA